MAGPLGAVSIETIIQSLRGGRVLIGDVRMHGALLPCCVVDLLPLSGNSTHGRICSSLDSVANDPERKEGQTALGSMPQGLAYFIGADCYQKWQRTQLFRADELESIAFQ